MTRASGSIGFSRKAANNWVADDLIPVGAAIGDSITNPDYNGSDRVTLAATPTNILKGAKGYMAWALALCGQRVRVPATTHVWSFPGMETSTILTSLPAFLAQMPVRPRFMVVECGTNNIGHDPTGATVGSFASITADWLAISDYLLARGIRPIFVPILPRIGGVGYFTTTALTLAQYEVIDRCNRWLNAMGQVSRGRVGVASSCLPDITDPASVGGQPRADYSYDGTHPAVAGSYYIGKAIGAILSGWYPPLDLLPNNNLAWAAGLTNVNYLTNGMMEGAGGTVTAPSSGTISGTAPTSWTASMSNTAGLTVANAQVASPRTGRRMHQMTFGGSYTVSGAALPSATFNQFGRLLQQPANGALATVAAGDQIEALIEFEIDAGNNAIAMPHLQFRWKGSANYNADMQIGEGYLPPEAIAGVLRTEPHVYQAGDLPLSSGDLMLNTYAYLRNTNGTYNPAAVIRFGRAVIRKV